MHSPDLSALPEPVFFTTGFDEILASCIQEYEEAYQEITGRTLELDHFSPEMLILRVFAYRENLFRINANEAARKNLLAYADGEKLDHLGAFFHIRRLPAQKARATLRFTFQEPLLHPIIIGTQVVVKTADNKFSFQVHQAAQIGRGVIYYDVTTECTGAGAAANDYPPGSITNLITPLPYVDSVTNILPSTGGADPEPDNNFRERIYLKPDSVSTTGSEEAYIFWTRSAHQDIIEVSVDSPRPGTVTIYPLLKNGEIPDISMLDRISATIHDEKIKTFTDLVEVSTPQRITVTVSISIQIYKTYIALQNQIQKQAEQIAGNWARYQIKLGRDIVPEQLAAPIQEIAGVYRVMVIQPQYRELRVNQFTSVESISITITGAVDV